MGSSEGYGADHWYFKSWGPLGWIETFFKFPAWIVGIIAAIETSDGQGDSQTAQAIIATALSVFIVFGIIDRLKLKDVWSMIFILFNNAGHIAFTYALFARNVTDGWLLGFCAPQIAGEFVKLEYFRRHLGSEFDVPDVKPGILYGFVLFYIVGYIALIVIQLTK